MAMKQEFPLIAMTNQHSRTTFDIDGTYGARNYNIIYYTDKTWFPAELNMCSRFGVDPFGRSLCQRRLLAFPCDPAISMWGDGRVECKR